MKIENETSDPQRIIVQHQPTGSLIDVLKSELNTQDEAYPVASKKAPHESCYNAPVWPHDPAITVISMSDFTTPANKPESIESLSTHIKGFIPFTSDSFNLPPNYSNEIANMFERYRNLQGNLYLATATGDEKRASILLFAQKNEEPVVNDGNICDAVKQPLPDSIRMDTFREVYSSKNLNIEIVSLGEANILASAFGGECSYKFKSTTVERRPCRESCLETDVWG